MTWCCSTTILHFRKLHICFFFFDDYDSNITQTRCIIAIKMREKKNGKKRRKVTFVSLTSVTDTVLVGIFSRFWLKSREVCSIYIIFIRTLLIRPENITTIFVFTFDQITQNAYHYVMQTVTFEIFRLHRYACKTYVQKKTNKKLIFFFSTYTRRYHTLYILIVPRFSLPFSLVFFFFGHFYYL